MRIVGRQSIWTGKGSFSDKSILETHWQIDKIKSFHDLEVKYWKLKELKRLRNVNSVNTAMMHPMM